MLATIREHRMWASGWWHVWKRMKRNGYRIERGPVRDIYRAENMVRLRSYSHHLAPANLTAGAVTQAARVCR